MFAGERQGQQGKQFRVDSLENFCATGMVPCLTAPGPGMIKAGEECLLGCRSGCGLVILCIRGILPSGPFIISKNCLVPGGVVFSQPERIFNAPKYHNVQKEFKIFIIQFCISYLKIYNKDKREDDQRKVKFINTHT